MWKETRRSILGALWSLITFSYFRNGNRETASSSETELKEGTCKVETDESQETSSSDAEPLETPPTPEAVKQIGYYKNADTLES